MKLKYSEFLVVKQEKYYLPLNAVVQWLFTSSQSEIYSPTIDDYHWVSRIWSVKQQWCSVRQFRSRWSMLIIGNSTENDCAIASSLSIQKTNVFTQSVAAVEVTTVMTKIPDYIKLWHRLQ